MLGESIDPTETDELNRLIEEKAEADKLRRLEEAEDLKVILATLPGRRFMWRLLEEAKTFRNPFTGIAAQTDFNCGQQNLGQRYLALIMEFAPSRFVEMLAEKEADAERRSKLASQ